MTTSVEPTLVCPVEDSSQVAEARRLAAALSRPLRWTESQSGRLALLVTEAAQNLVKHAGGGQLLMRLARWSDQPGRERHGLELVALDRGPGMPSVAACLRDGYSTAGSPGTGLGAIARQASYWDLYSCPGSGTALLIRLWTNGGGKPQIPWEPSNPVGGWSIAKPGESECGDAWDWKRVGQAIWILVCDGLGHGILAAEASRAAVSCFRQTAEKSPAASVRSLHAALKRTRGAAVGVACISPEEGRLRFAGVGNIVGRILQPDERTHLVSYNGTAGLAVTQVREFVYDWKKEATLVLNSDGLVSQWSLDSYPGLVGRDPALIASVMYRDFRRGRDDATVVVAKGV